MTAYEPCHPANLEHLLLTDKICFSKLQSEDISSQVRININITLEERELFLQAKHK